MYTHFSKYVVDCIRKGDYAIAEGFLGPEYIVKKNLLDNSEMKRLGWADSPIEQDDWSLHLTSWLFGLFPRVSLIRGGSRYNVKLTKEEHRGLAIIYNAIFEERKDRIKEQKRKFKEQERLAYWL